MNLKRSSLGILCLTLSCGGGGESGKPANTAGSSSGGGGSAAVGGGGMTNAGTSGSGGAGGSGQSQAGSGGNAGGTSNGGTSNGGSASGGSAGTSGSGGGNSTVFSCPAGPFDAPKAMGMPKRVEGVPPADAFNNNNNDFTNIEGLVWIGDALYVSEINPGKAAQNSPPPSRVLKITADDVVSVAIAPDSGSNGLAVNAAGDLFGALHKDGSISKLSLTGGPAVPLVSMFMGARFDSPNDLAFHTNGTLYFTDPDWQSPTPKPQAATRAYRVPPGGQPEAIEVLNQPNGVSLSAKQDFLYIGGGQLKKYPVMADGSLGAGSYFHTTDQATTSDGMVVDCADNVYAAGASCNDGCVGKGATIFSAAGAVIGTISVGALGSGTNVAFGGADHKTLYISGQGTGQQKGLFKVPMNVPGFPY